jgi:MtrB/PioB family decaheme-associated outer membrane protein
MKKMTTVLKLTAVAAALLSVYGPLHAADDEEMAQLIKPESAVSIGIGHWSKDRPHEGLYDGMRENGSYGLVDADINKRDDATGTWMTLRARNLGLETRELRGEYLRQGNIGASIDYSRTVRDNRNKFFTGLQGIGTSNLLVSTNASPLPFREVELGTVRDGTTLGLYKNLMPGVDFNLSFRNEEKTGERHWGRGGTGEFAVEPIDSTTREMEATVSYTGERLQLSGGYNGSWYDTHETLVDSIRNGDNPATLNNHNFLSLPLDNEAHQIFLDGGYSFTPSTRGRFKVEYTHATQNENLPTQSIPGLSLAGSPSKLKGEVNTTLVQLGLTSQVTRALSLTGSFRYHDADDETPVRRFIQSNPACNSGQCVDNTPFSYKTQTGKVDATYRLPKGYSLSGGFERREEERWIPVSNANGAGGADTQRVVPMRDNVDEDTYRLQLRRAFSDVMGGSLAYIYSDRTGSDYITAGVGPGGAPSDLINPINIADRERNKWRVALDWTPVERVSVQFIYENSRDDYDHSTARPFGLHDGKAELYALDVSYQLNDDWQMSAWYSKDFTKAVQVAQRASPAAIKEAHLTDRGDTVGLSMKGMLTSKLRVGADLNWSAQRSKYDETITPTAVSDLPSTPTIENELTTLKLFAQYALQRNSELRFDFIHERWTTDDWTWQFANGSPFIYGTTTDGTVVTAKDKQTSNFIGARYIYKFQ